MPEMPEVQAHAERMTAALGGRRLSKFELLNFAALKTFDPPVDAAVGQALTEVGRRGKYLLIGFDNGHTHVVHLMQGAGSGPTPSDRASRNSAWPAGSSTTGTRARRGRWPGC